MGPGPIQPCARAFSPECAAKCASTGDACHAWGMGECPAQPSSAILTVHASRNESEAKTRTAQGLRPSLAAVPRPPSPARP
eukprot:13821152-Alexandrium_andersonii.AAC.1